MHVRDKGPKPRCFGPLCMPLQLDSTLMNLSDKLTRNALEESLLPPGPLLYVLTAEGKAWGGESPLSRHVVKWSLGKKRRDFCRGRSF